MSRNEGRHHVRTVWLGHRSCHFAVLGRLPVSAFQSLGISLVVTAKIQQQISPVCAPRVGQRWWPLPLHATRRQPAWCLASKQITKPTSALRGKH